jgi:hypothetical protein
MIEILKILFVEDMNNVLDSFIETEYKVFLEIIILEVEKFLWMVILYIEIILNISDLVVLLSDLKVNYDVKWG